MEDEIDKKQGMIDMFMCLEQDYENLGVALEEFSHQLFGIEDEDLDLLELKKKSADINTWLDGFETDSLDEEIKRFEKMRVIDKLRTSKENEDED